MPDGSGFPLPRDLAIDDELFRILHGMPRDEYQLTHNYRELDHRLDGRGEQFNRLAEVLTEQIATTSAAERTRRNRLAAHTRIVLANVISTVFRDRITAISYSRRPNEYCRRYTGPVTHRGLIPVVDGMTELGYLRAYPGYRRFDGARRSRIRATEKLSGLVFDEHKLNPGHLIRDNTPPESIILRNADKDDIDYEDTPATRDMRRVLDAYNEFLRGSDIRLADERPDSVLPWYPHVRRIFNEAFESGGRFYGPWSWWPKRVRPFIRINGARTVELDYAATVLHQVYSLAGADYYHNRARDDDPYAVPGFEFVPRSERKMAFLYMLNTPSEPEAIRLIDRHGIPADVPDYDTRELVTAIRRKHEPIDAWFYRENACHLQFLDSQVCERIIRDCMRENVVVLTIHDSFIVEDRHAEFLHDLMIRAWREKGLCSVPKITIERG
ncbi:MAG: hypothetical protein ACM30I_05555 [Gemmatimonas sp.]